MRAVDCKAVHLFTDQDPIHHIPERAFIQEAPHPKLTPWEPLIENDEVYKQLNFQPVGINFFTMNSNATTWRNGSENNNFKPMGDPAIVQIPWSLGNKLNVGQLRAAVRQAIEPFIRGGKQNQTQTTTTTNTQTCYNKSTYFFVPCLC
jgi:hypothetical protein